MCPLACKCSVSCQRRAPRRSARPGFLAALGFRARFRALFHTAPQRNFAAAAWVLAVSACRFSARAAPRVVLTRERQTVPRRTCPEASPGPTTALSGLLRRFRVWGFRAPSALASAWLPRGTLLGRSVFPCHPGPWLIPADTSPGLSGGSNAYLRAAREWELKSEPRANKGCANAKGWV